MTKGENLGSKFFSKFSEFIFGNTLNFTLIFSYLKTHKFTPRLKNENVLKCQILLKR